MPDTQAPAFQRIAVTGALFALAVAVGELTFGNRDFPLNVWYFEKIPAWQWSLPVHLTGFVWLVICDRIFRGKSALAPVFLSLLFFFAGETLNWYFLDYFTYAGSRAWERILSFWVVIAMYTGLCAGAVLILRIPARKPAGIDRHSQ